MKKDHLARKRVNRLKEIGGFLSITADKVDYLDIADMYKISPAQARKDILHIIAAKPKLKNKVYYFEPVETINYSKGGKNA